MSTEEWRTRRARHPREQGPFPACCHLGAVLWGILLVIEMMPAAAFTEPFFFFFHRALYRKHTSVVSLDLYGKAVGRVGSQPWTLQPDCQDPAWLCHFLVM